MLTIDNVATQDAYVDALTLGPSPTAEQIVYTVANAAVRAQLAGKTASGTQDDWGAEILLPPSSNVIARVTGMRFRSAVAGSPAQVVAQLVQPADPAPGAGVPFLSTLAASGAVGAGVQIPEVTLASWPPASPTEQQVVVLVLPSSYDPVGGKPVRWLCQYDAANGLWHAIGPAPLYAEVQTSEGSNGNATYGNNCATTGPSIGIPRPGDYSVEVGTIAQPSANLEAYAAPSGAGISASDGDGVVVGITNNAEASAARAREKTGLVAGTITLQYRSTAAGFGSTYRNRYIRVIPLRIT